jgi:hypothetical protein
MRDTKVTTYAKRDLLLNIHQSLQEMVSKINLPPSCILQSTSLNVVGDHNGTLLVQKLLNFIKFIGEERSDKYRQRKFNTATVLYLSKLLALS